MSKGGNDQGFHGDGEKLVDNTATAALIWLCLSAAVGLLLLTLYWLNSKSKKKPTRATLIAGTQAETGAMRAQTAGGVRRRPRTGRQRMMARRTDYDMADDDMDFVNDSEDEVPADGEEMLWQDDEPAAKVGTKKLKKLQEKAMKKEQRELEQKDREERKKQEELRRKELEEDKEKEKELQEKQEEEERLLKEEQDKKEYEEYLILKQAFTVDEEGESGILSEQESQALLQEFIDFIKEKKVVMLEELAAQFDLRVQEAIKRVEDLQELGRLTGVMDDRGKFIYISQQELEDVARYVKQRGRVAITELAEASSTLITLQGTSSPNKIDTQPIVVS